MRISVSVPVFQFRLGQSLALLAMRRVLTLRYLPLGVVLAIVLGVGMIPCICVCVLALHVCRLDNRDSWVCVLGGG